MKGNQDAILRKAVSRPSSPGLGWNECSRALVERLAAIKPMMFSLSEARERR